MENCSCDREAFGELPEKGGFFKDTQAIGQVLSNLFSVADIPIL